jgi:hypothetical protein
MAVERPAQDAAEKAAGEAVAIDAAERGVDGPPGGGIVGGITRGRNSLEGLRDVRNLSEARLQTRSDTCGLYAGASVLGDIGSARGSVDFSRVRGQIRANRVAGRGTGLESLELESFLERNVADDVAVLGMSDVKEPQLPALLVRGHLIAHVDGNHWVRILGTVQDEDGGSTWVRIYDPARGNHEQLLSRFMTRAGQGNRMILIIR